MAGMKLYKNDLYKGEGYRNEAEERAEHRGFAKLCSIIVAVVLAIAVFIIVKL